MKARVLVASLFWAATAAAGDIGGFLEGVKEIDVPVVPGPLCVSGKNALP